jgi:serine/threonine-protein phosphatase 2A regulatory subunit B'
MISDATWLINSLLIDSPDPHEREQLFCMKLRQCCVIFDFTELLSDFQHKEIKKNALQEMFDYLGAPTSRNVLTEAIYSEMFNMVSSSYSIFFL